MMAWLPVFFLYFNEHLELKEVLFLESVYYLSVVILEVPSGFFSDRYGRRITLILSSVFFVIAYLIFGIIEPTFIHFSIGQVFLAAAISFNSGTDTAFYFESLQEQGKEDEFSTLEAKVQSSLQYTGAFAVLLGGFVGAVKLNLPYIASLIFVVPALIISFKFKEPKFKTILPELANKNQIIATLSYLKNKELKWIFTYSVIVYILAHIPYEFYQPYLNLLDLESLSLNTAISSGVLFALTRVFGAYAAGKSVVWTRKYGLKYMCIFSIVLQLFIIGILSLALHPIFILILMLRSFSMSLTTAPINAEIAPRILKEHRAGYFSLQSLGSRLAFSICLVLLTLPVGQDVINDWPTLSKELMISCVVGAIISLSLIIVKSGQLFSKTNHNH